MIVGTEPDDCRWETDEAEGFASSSKKWTIITTVKVECRLRRRMVYKLATPNLFAALLSLRSVASVCSSMCTIHSRYTPNPCPWFECVSGSARFVLLKSCELATHSQIWCHHQYQLPGVQQFAVWLDIGLVIQRDHVCETRKKTFARRT